MTALSSIRKHPVVTVAVTLIAAVLVGWWLNPWHADAAGGTESVLTPITPCRAVDTREAIGLDRTTKIGEGEAVNVSFAGGVGGCVLPDNITAVSANIFAVAPTATSPVSFFTVGPADEELSTTSVLNFNNQLAVFGNEIRIPLSADGAATIFNAFGNVHLVADINGYYTPTPASGSVSQADFDELQGRVIELEALLAGVERAPDDNGYDTITFAAVNLQIVDGTGTTYGTPSGLGNVIIGYNEESAGGNIRIGAHNLVIGDEHDYRSTGADHAAGGIVAGYNNSIAHTAASVTGGANNTASGSYSSVTGGGNSNASGSRASVSGGNGNTASGGYSSVTGGQLNTAAGDIGSITGGYLNVNDSSFSSILGGRENEIDNTVNYAVVVGGEDNTVTGDNSVVVGGSNNLASGQNAVAVGGAANQANADATVTVGGLANSTDANLSVSVGGTETSTTGSLTVSIHRPAGGNPTDCAAGACATAVGNYS